VDEGQSRSTGCSSTRSCSSTATSCSASALVQKLDWNKKDANGKRMEPEPLGFMPIGDETWMYEFTDAGAAPAWARTVFPTWKSDMPGEKEHVIKLPQAVLQEHVRGEDPQLTEDVGEAMAKWAAGGAAKQPAKTGRTVADIVREFDVCDLGGFGQLQDEATVIWEKCNERQQALLTTARDKASARLSADVTP
jgi:hypothetical protein